MRHIRVLMGVVLLVGIAVGLLGGRMLTAQDPLKSGTILDRTDLSGTEGMEAILVLRELPPGGESGRHTQSGKEIVYILEGSVILEVEGKPAVTLGAGETFQTSSGEVHNVKNASASAPAQALAFYIAKKGASLEDLALPAQ
ncbi:MAG: cupin domain-containing protein [Thermoanaerobaculia bacterium]